MDRQYLINNTIEIIKQLPDVKVQEINDYAEFLLSRIDDRVISDGIAEIISESGSFDFLEEDENIYTVKDLKVRYK